jgi:uncharacterized membrane protein
MADNSSQSNTTSTGIDITIAVIVVIIAAGIFAVFADDLKSIYANSIGWVFSGGFRGFYTSLAFIFTILDAILLAFVIFVTYRFNTLGERIPADKPTETHTVEPREEIREGWQHVRELANSSSSSDWNMAIIRADALLDDVLQHLGYEGVTLADRLKIVDPTKLTSLDRVWSAHRLRNAIAHDPMEQHTKESIVHALRSYQEAFRELGMMEE